MWNAKTPRQVAAFCLSLLWLLSLAATSFAQFETATVLGTVQDSTGAAIAGAKVTLKNLATGITVTAQSDVNGNYQFSNVKIGDYEVMAEKEGFAKAVTEKINVTINARQRVDLSLKTGAVTETVTVTAQAAQLEADSSDRGQVINREQIINLPLN